VAIGANLEPPAAPPSPLRGPYLSKTARDGPESGGEWAFGTAPRRPRNLASLWITL